MVSLRFIPGNPRKHAGQPPLNSRRKRTEHDARTSCRCSNFLLLALSAGVGHGVPRSPWESTRIRRNCLPQQRFQSFSGKPGEWNTSSGPRSQTSDKSRQCGKRLTVHCCPRRVSVNYRRRITYGVISRLTAQETRQPVALNSVHNRTSPRVPPPHFTRIVFQLFLKIVRIRYVFPGIVFRTAVERIGVSEHLDGRRRLHTIARSR